ncbi:MAG: NADPH-dependent FMN reductase [Solirubrobacteraceae bacterium]
MPTLQVLIASTRPGRVGFPVAQWFSAHANDHGGFSVDVADLAAIGLPLLDEPNHPRLRTYTHQHTRDWSARVEAADAFAFVTPEYNHGPSAALINALSYLHQEWKYKPAGFVSYGGVSAGTRGVEVAKLVATTLDIVVVSPAVSIPFVQQFLDQDGRIAPNEVMRQAATTMLDELVQVEAALRPLR